MNYYFRFLLGIGIVTTIESDQKMKTNESIPLSIQELIDYCDYNEKMRNNGPTIALDYIENNRITFKEYYHFVGLSHRSSQPKLHVLFESLFSITNIFFPSENFDYYPFYL